MNIKEILERYREETERKLHRVESDLFDFPCKRLEDEFQELEDLLFYIDEALGNNEE